MTKEEIIQKLGRAAAIDIILQRELTEEQLQLVLEVIEISMDLAEANTLKAIELRNAAQ
ncbi:hypothetical protein [Xanthomonas phage X1]|nr:hypothetical protein [Xanthomonas phage X1]